MIRRRIQGLEGPERLQALKAALADLPGYHQGPYGQLRRWVLDLIAAEQARGEVRHKDSYFLPRQGAAQIALVGPASSGKSSLLHALTGRRAAVGDYPCTTLRPQAGMVDCQGAQIQLIDLPGLLPGAAEGRGGGRAAMAAIRMADAALHLVALGPADLAESLAVEAELALAGVDVPFGVVATKSDLPGAAERLRDLEAAYPGRAVAVCSALSGEGLDRVRALAWQLSGLLRVYCRPRGAAASPDAVVLRRGADVRTLAATLNRSWPERLRRALVTGPSARFAGQAVGPGHLLADGDTVELWLG